MTLYERVIKEFSQKFNGFETVDIKNSDLLLLGERACIINEDNHTQFLTKIDPDLIIDLFVFSKGSTSIPMSKIIEGRYE